MREIFSNIVMVLMSLMLLVIGRLALQKIRDMKQKTTNDSVRNLLEKFEYIIKLCVESTNQTFVDDLKKQNLFDDEKKQEAFMQTFEAVQLMLTDSDKQQIMNEFGDPSTFIKTSVENYIKENKDFNIDVPV